MPVMQRQYNYALFEKLLQPRLEQPDYRHARPAHQLKRFRNNTVEHVETDHDFSLEGKQVSEEEYWEKYYSDTPYEWNNGILEVKPLSDFRSNLLRIWFEALLHEYRNIQKDFQEIACEIGFKMTLKKGSKVRKPDIGFVGPTSLQMAEDDRTYKGIFDLCVEFLSDSRYSEVKRDTEQKFREYEEAGVKEYFILDRNQNHTAFYRLKNGRYVKLSPQDGVICSEVLKGFQFRIEHLYTRPDLEDLIEDPVYDHYVKLDAKRACSEMRRANNEMKRADQNEKLLEVEKKRAEENENLLETEKKRAEENEKLLETEKKRAEENERLLELYRKKLFEHGVVL
jgi:Uma2 family endonuclease